MVLIGSFSTKETAPEVVWEDFFEVDGVMYHVMKEVPAHLAVAYLNDVKTDGSERAIAILMHNVVSTGGMQALAKVKTLSMEHFKAVVRVVEKKVFEAVGEATGN